MLSANMIISGSIGSFGEKYLVSLKFIDVETGETVNTVSVYYDDMEDILKKSENLVEKLLEGLADTENSELASGANNTKPKAGYFSISAGYSEIFRETDNGPLASNLPNLENGGIYGSAENATDTATETFSNFYTHQLLEGVPITLGYEFPFLPGFSAGVWGSYLVGECYTDNYLLSGSGCGFSESSKISPDLFTVVLGYIEYIDLKLSDIFSDSNKPAYLSTAEISLISFQKMSTAVRSRTRIEAEITSIILTPFFIYNSVYDK